jgi:hypothetical protein
MRIRTQKKKFNIPFTKCPKIGKTPIRRVDEKRVYPRFKMALATKEKDGSVSLKWYYYIPSTEVYVKKYFEDNAAENSLRISLGAKPNRLQIKFVPCIYLVGDKEFIA